MTAQITIKRDFIIATLVCILLLGITYVVVNIAVHYESSPPVMMIEGEYKQPREGATGKEGATDIPSWAEGEQPFVEESGRDFARRVLDKKYGPKNHPTGPGSEFSKLKKYADRHFK
ncbi:hypothetical protein QUF58_02545 [Anaerolineales bacterium HSG24]|nr:hypothetical protein [Anaerolineales bacterium HSG24]